MMIAAALIVTSPVFAQGPACRPIEVWFKILDEQYNERIVFKGTDSKGRTMVVTMSNKGTWSLVTLGETIACVVGSGIKSTLYPGEAS